MIDDDWDDQSFRGAVRDCGWFRAVRWWLATQWWWAAYAVRPYDILAARRRWFWQQRTPCQFSGGKPYLEP